MTDQPFGPALAHNTGWEDLPSCDKEEEGPPGAWAVLFQRAVGSDPAGCASRRAHRVETAIAFRLHNALGTQNERYFVAVNPTAHSLACLRIGVFVTADAARLATGVGGSPFTGRVSHPLDGKQSFMTSPHRHSPLTSLAWSHHATTPRPVAACAATAGRFVPVARARAAAHKRRWSGHCRPRPRASAGGACALTRCRVVRGGGVMRYAGRQVRPCGAAGGLAPPAPAAPDRRPAGLRRRAVPAH